MTDEPAENPESADSGQTPSRADDVANRAAEPETSPIEVRAFETEDILLGNESGDTTHLDLIDD